MQRVTGELQRYLPYPLFRYGAALLIVGIAVLVRMALVPLWGLGIPYVTLFPAIVYVAMVLGPGPAVAASIVGSIAVDILLFEPAETFRISVVSVSRDLFVLASAIYLGRVSRLLRESEARFSRAIEESAFPTMLHAEGGEVLQINRIWTEITGYTVNEIPTVEEWVRRAYPSDEEKVLADIARLYSLTRREEEGTYEVVTKAGERRVWEFSSAPVGRLRDGRRLVVSMAHDVTRRKKAEEALRESEEALRIIFNSTYDGILVHSLDGRVIEANQTFLRMYHIAPEEATSVTIRDLSAPSMSMEQVARYWTKVMAGEPQLFEWRAQRADRVEFDVEVYLRRIQRRGEGVILANVRDITERKQAERDLREVQRTLQQSIEELGRSNRELEQFAYVASHDLQEPLRMVASYVQLLEKRYKGRLDEKADTYIHFAVDGALRMQKLVEGLLAYSRISRRGGEFQQVEANDLFARAVANLTTSINESGASVTRDELPRINGDEVQLTQLFQNLIANGIKYHRPETPPRVHVTASHRDGEWLFSVTDNGIGIEAEYFERVFLIFQRLHTRNEYPGTGIGLALCKRIVERHRGRIWVESAPGEGSNFLFTIPEGGTE